MCCFAPDFFFFFGAQVAFEAQASAWLWYPYFDDASSVQVVEASAEHSYERNWTDHAEHYESPERQAEVLLEPVLDLELKGLVIDVYLFGNKVNIGVFEIMPRKLDRVFLALLLHG